MKKEIKIGDKLYYNNREVLIVGVLKNELYICACKYDVNIEIDGSNFCSACQIGGRSSHTCNEADEVIDAVIEEIDENNCITIIVPKSLLHEHQVEWYKNEKLSKKIEEQQAKFEKIQDDCYESLSSFERMKKEKESLEKEIQALETKKNKKEEDVNEACRELDERLEKRKQDVINTIKIESSEISISKKMLLDYIEDRVMMGALSEAGVDNWEGYSYAIDCLEEEYQSTDCDEIARGILAEMLTIK